MCHKEQQMGTMVEMIQPFSATNFLYNMIKISANTGNALTPSRLRTPFGARHGSTCFCGWCVFKKKRKETKQCLPVHIPNWKRAIPYPQLERGRSLSQIERGRSISPTKKGLIHIPNQNGAGPYRQLERGHVKSVDEGSASKMAQKDAWCAAAPPWGGTVNAKDGLSRA